MDLEKIEGLVKIIEDSSLNEFTYKDKDVKITMSKLDHPPVVATGVPVAASAPVNTIVEKAEEEEEESLFITSPIVGTFYSAAAPDVPAFVKVGDQVKAGDAVCTLYVNDDRYLDDAKELLHEAVTITSEKGEIRPMIYGVVTEKDV